MGKEVGMTYLKVLSDICLERPREAVKIRSQDILPPGQYLDWDLPVSTQNANVLLTESQYSILTLSYLCYQTGNM
jgi:hypothetical protein